MLPVRTILHPTDFSPNSQYALHVAAALARDYDAELIVMHVHAIPVALYGEAGVAPVPDTSAAEQAELDSIDIPGVRVSRVMTEGEPVGEILRVAEERHADMIVMGTHGRRGLTRLVMGSVSELVVRRANCPVLTVRTPVVAEATPATEAALAGSHP
jgi:nucleotide-binding universal stress UspA family protein